MCPTVPPKRTRKHFSLSMRHRRRLHGRPVAVRWRLGGGRWRLGGGCQGGARARSQAPALHEGSLG
eukprot:6011101-Heterocapsa_arctica.AAC.1